MALSVFTAGGMIIDNMAAWDGTIARGLAGGNAVYSAVAASLWLEQVGVTARVPRNYPPAAWQALRDAGLDLDGVSAEPADVDWSEWFFHRPDGTRVDHLHASDAEADAFGMTGCRVPAELVRRFEAHLAGRPDHGGHFKAFRAAHPVTVAQVTERYWQAKGVHLGPNLPDAQIGLAREARRRGLIVTCDPGFHAGQMGKDQLGELLRLADAFLPSEKELALLCPGTPVADALMELSSRGDAMVGVKCGARGAFLLEKGRSSPWHVPALPADALDPTGAGDAFCGGFLAGLVLGDEVLHAGFRGAASASLAIETAGAAPRAGAGHEARRRLSLGLARAGQPTQDFPKMNGAP